MMTFSQSLTDECDCEEIDKSLKSSTEAMARCSQCGKLWRTKGHGWYVPGIFEVLRLEKQGRLPK